MFSFLYTIHAIVLSGFNVTDCTVHTQKGKPIQIKCELAQQRHTANTIHIHFFFG